MCIVALRELKNLAIKQGFLIPGDAAWPLGGLFAPPLNKAEGGGSFRHQIRYFSFFIVKRYFTFLQIPSVHTLSKREKN